MFNYILMDGFLETSNNNIVVLFNYHKAKKVGFFS